MSGPKYRCNGKTFDSASEVIDLYREYVALLEKRLGQTEAIAFVHGMECPKEMVDEGVKLRESLGLTQQNREES